MDKYYGDLKHGKFYKCEKCEQIRLLDMRFYTGWHCQCGYWNKGVKTEVKDGKM